MKTMSKALKYYYPILLPETVNNPKLGLNQGLYDCKVNMLFSTLFTHKYHVKVC